MHSRHAIPLLVLVGVVFALSITPMIGVRVVSGEAWQGVPPVLASDSLYYFARAREIVDGFPFIGNPYFIEHQNTVAPSFFIPDWLYAIPLLLGFSIATVSFLNFSIWSVCFAVLVYGLLYVLRLPRAVAVLGAVFAYAQVYALILRPISMQQVFPFYVLFLIALALWLRSPMEQRYRIFLALTAAASFYLYAYLWQIIVAVGLCAGTLVLLRRRSDEVRHTLGMGALAVALALPAVGIMVRQFAQSYYWETMERLGLVMTHIPTWYTVYYLRWVGVLLVIACMLAWRRKEHEAQYQSEAVTYATFFGLTGAGLVIALLSNVVTGRELETATHIGRFVMLWLAIGFVVYAHFIVRHRAVIVRFQKYIVAILGVLMVISAIGLLRNMGRALPRDVFSQAYLMQLQEYAAPLVWLEQNEETPVVIWGDEVLSSYIPVMTKHYVLFANEGKFQLAPSSEIAERFLAAQYFENLSLEDIKKSLVRYAGVGVAKHQAGAKNEEVKFCRVLRLAVIGVSCGRETDAITLKGEQYFVQLKEQYGAMQEDISPMLMRYHVQYIVKDKKITPAWQPEMLPRMALVYEDQRFVIFKVE